MRAQIIITALLLTATFGNAAWRTALQELLGITADCGNAPRAHTTTSSLRSPCGEVPCHDLAPNMTRVWILRNYTQVLVKSLEPWIDRLALLDDYFANTNDAHDLFEHQIAVHNRLNFDALENGKAISSAMWDLVEKTTWMFTYLGRSMSFLTAMDNDRDYLAGRDATDMGTVATENKLRCVDSLCAKCALAAQYLGSAFTQLYLTSFATARLDRLIELEVASIASKSGSRIGGLLARPDTPQLAALAHIVRARNAYVEYLGAAECLNADKELAEIEVLQVAVKPEQEKLRVLSEKWPSIQRARTVDQIVVAIQHLQ